MASIWPPAARSEEALAAEAERRELVEVELGIARTELEFTQESLADLELALEDRGWLALSVQAAQEFTREGRRRASGLCRILTIQNPLVKQGVAVRTAYIWGGGVELQATDPLVNEVVQEFLDDNARTLSGSQAQEELEKSLATDGNVFMAAFTGPRTGRVQVRSFNPDEIDEIITNPEDRSEPWYYLRRWQQEVLEPGYGVGVTRTRMETRRALHPALGYYPPQRPRNINGVEVRWDAPVLHHSVNRVDGWSFGIGDTYAAIAWARAYKEFLEDWAKLTKALSRYAWRITAPTKGRAQAAAAAAHTAAAAGYPNESNAGSTAAMTAGTALESIPKSGATIDADSGRPLAGMIASALGIPVTMLLSDPGVTGARATAQTLDRPTELMATMRRSSWTAFLRELLDYVVAQSVKAPGGKLRGSVSRDEWGREVVQLRGEDADASVDIDWPPLDKINVKERVESIVEADSTAKVPPLTIAAELLKALGVDNIDEVLEELQDDDGNFIDPKTTAGGVALDRFDRGEDPEPLGPPEEPPPPAEGS
jgi:hypothetical protein